VRCVVLGQSGTEVFKRAVSSETQRQTEADPGFAGLFKNICFRQELDEQGADLAVPVDRLAEWLDRYNAWFEQKCLSAASRAFMITQNRSAALTCERLLLICDKIGMLAEKVHAGLMQLQVTLDLASCIEDRERLETLLDTGVGKIYLAAPNADRKKPEPDRCLPDRCLSVVESITQRNVRLVFTGPVQFWIESGALELEGVNALNFEMSPQRCGRTGSLRYRRPFDPCKARFQLFVCVDGLIYPCDGVAGLAHCALGSIADDLADTVLGSRASFLDLKTLSAGGPEIKASEDLGEDRLGDTLPLVCRLHRKDLLKDA